MSAAVVRTVGALLVDSQGRVLLGLRSAHRKAWPDHWDSIGGRVETGETPEQAIVREVREEIGVEVVDVMRLEEIAEPRPDLYGASVSTIYVVTRWAGEPQNVSDEHIQLGWFGATELATLTSLAAYDYPRLAKRAREMKRSRPASNE